MYTFTDSGGVRADVQDGLVAYTDSVRALDIAGSTPLVLGYDDVGDAFSRLGSLKVV